MKVSYKSVYTLLSNYYVRISSIDSFISQFSEDTFSAAIMFATQNEDYRFLSVMTSEKKLYENEFALFYRNDGSEPISLMINKDLNIFELSVLCKKSNGKIPSKEFEIIIEASCDNLKIDKTDLIKQFNSFLTLKTT